MSVRNLDKRLFTQNLYSDFAKTRNVGGTDKPSAFWVLNHTALPKTFEASNSSCSYKCSFNIKFIEQSF